MNGLHYKFKLKFNFGSHHFSLLYMALKSNFNKQFSLKWLLHDAMNISTNSFAEISIWNLMELARDSTITILYLEITHSKYHRL